MLCRFLSPFPQRGKLSERLPATPSALTKVVYVAWLFVQSGKERGWRQRCCTLRKQSFAKTSANASHSIPQIHSGAVRFYEKRGFIKSGRESDLFGMRLYEYAKPLCSAYEREKKCHDPWTLSG